eukprot:2100695-Alexandrium_andersonii.AAC.1
MLPREPRVRAARIASRKITKCIPPPRCPMRRGAGSARAGRGGSAWGPGRRPVAAPECSQPGEFPGLWAPGQGQALGPWGKSD